MVDLNTPGSSRRFFPSDTTDGVFPEDDNEPENVPLPPPKRFHPKPRVIEVGLDEFIPSQTSKPTCNKQPQKQPITWKSNKTLELRKAQAQAKVKEAVEKEKPEELKLIPEEEKRLMRLYMREHGIVFFKTPHF